MLEQVAFQAEGVLAVHLPVEVFLREVLGDLPWTLQRLVLVVRPRSLIGPQRRSDLRATLGIDDEADLRSRRFVEHPVECAAPQQTIAFGVPAAHVRMHARKPKLHQILPRLAGLHEILPEGGAMFVDGNGVTDVWPQLLGLAIFGATLIPGGMFVFAVAERWAKKTGRLKRQG